MWETTFSTAASTSASVRLLAGFARAAGCAALIAAGFACCTQSHCVGQHFVVDRAGGICDMSLGI